MKKTLRALLVAVLLLSSLVLLAGCGEASKESKNTAAVQNVVAAQDTIYNTNQPIPLFNYSIPRDLWIQYYKATTSGTIRTWSVVVSDYGKPLFYTPSIGMPIPAGTQLTNPNKLSNLWTTSPAGGYEDIMGTLPQDEPNGLYTDPNTNATIIMTVDGNGQVAPVYSEPKVMSFPFPVHQDANGMWVRDTDATSSLKLDVNTTIEASKATAAKK